MALSISYAETALWFISNNITLKNYWILKEMRFKSEDCEMVQQE
jgi:hypothetical protein